MHTVAIRLLVGLGNPGPEYHATRHNAGFWLIDQLAAANTLSAQGRFFGAVGRMRFDSGQDVYLLKPSTYMNLSGQAVAALANFYKLPPTEILIVHDELDLEPGVARFKQGGGHGGHNGLKDIIARLGSAAFWRLRLGIGHPGHRDAVLSYVLKKPRAEEQVAIDDAIARALAVLPLTIAGEMAKAMKQLHTLTE